MPKTCERINEFCVCCAKYIKAKSRQNITKTVEKNYKSYFDKDLPTGYYIGKIICSTCSTTISPRIDDKKRLKINKFNWLEPDYRHTNCVICTTKVKKYFRRSVESSAELDEFDFYLKQREEDEKSTTSLESPIPSTFNFDFDASFSSPLKSSNCSEYLLERSNYTSKKKSNPIKFNSLSLENFIKDFQFSKKVTKKLTSRFNDMNYLDESCRVKQFDTRSDYIAPYFTQFDNKTVYLNDLLGFFKNIIQIPYDEKEWRLFLDSGKGSFKAVLLHIGKCKVFK